VVKQKKMAIVSEPTGVAVSVYDLKAAATAFSEGQDPEMLGRVYLERRKAKRPGLFIAKVLGNSMNRVAPDGSWCLWQHIGAAGVPPPAPGEYLLVRREDPDDPHLGDFTFKRWEPTPSGARLAPVSRDPKFQPILLSLEDEQVTTHLARFVEVLHFDEADVVT